MINEKKYVILSLCALFCILTIAFSIVLGNKIRTIDGLMSQLENAINKHNIEKIIELYPDYCKEKVEGYFSQERLNDFYNDIIVETGEKVNIQIKYTINYDASDCDNITEEIAYFYNKNVIVEDYQILGIEYHNSFSESQLQVIKIKGKYYLYYGGFLGEPISFFAK